MTAPRFAPLFVTGLARSGTTLLGRMLGAHPEVEVASDPLLPVFASFRSAVLTAARKAGDDVVDPALPFQDYYFTDPRIRTLDRMQAASLDLPLPPGEQERLAGVLPGRAKDEAADLLDHLGRIRGGTYAEYLASALNVVADARATSKTRYVGVKEVWILELFPALLRAFPDARFLLVMRDPRANLHSMLALNDRYPAEAGQALSYARHWRKHAAFCWRHLGDPELARRFLVLRYEDLVLDPERCARIICRLLDVSYDPTMVELERRIDPAHGRTWNNNSSFGFSRSGVSSESVERWREGMPGPIRKLVELVCSPEMLLHGYEPSRIEGVSPDPEVLAYLIESGEAVYNWRTDLQDVQQDYGFELFRHALLRLSEPPADVNLVRRSFLFVQLYAHLRTLLGEGLRSDRAA